jgi:hypothetical protein
MVRLATIPMPAYLEYASIRASADEFLLRNGWRGEIPVNIERIIDVAMQIDIVREPELTKRLDLEGFLTRDRKTIYVDDYTQDVLENRYRFTLAHEVGHHELHKAIYTKADFQTIPEFKDFLRRLPEQVKARLEYQANCFAGLILAPATQLASAVSEAAFRARSRWYEVDLNEAADRGYIIPIVARRLAVSGDVVEIRGRFDGLWQ